MAEDVVSHQIAVDTLHGKQSVVHSTRGVGEGDVSRDLHDLVSNDDHTIALMAVSFDSGDQRSTIGPPRSGWSRTWRSPHTGPTANEQRASVR